MLKSAICFNCKHFGVKYLCLTGGGDVFFYEIGNSNDTFEIRDQKRAAKGIEEVNCLPSYRIVLDLCTALQFLSINLNFTIQHWALFVFLCAFRLETCFFQRLHTLQSYFIAPIGFF